MSNRKKWRWVFVGFSIVIFITIAVVLVLFNKSNDKSNKDDQSDNSTQPTEVYATSFSLNIPDTIQILVDTKIKFASGYVNVTPASMLNKLICETNAKSGGNINFQ